MPNVRIDLCGKCQAGFPALHNFFFLNMIDNTWLKQCYSVPHALSWLSCYIYDVKECTKDQLQSNHFFYSLAIIFWVFTQS